ncbi:ComF family protein, partial [Clostridium tarantellae]
MGKRKQKFIKYIYECLLEVIYPSKSVCINCSKDLEKEYLCEKCLNEVKLIKDKEYLDNNELYVCGYYSYTLKNLIFKLKYNKDFNVGLYLVELMNEKIKENNLQFDYILYIPTSKKKLKEKGFNQCEFLAKELSKKTNIKVINIIIKKDNIKEQKLLSSLERKKNMSKAFYISKEVNLNNKTILLIDDVITTGSTLIS